MCWCVGQSILSAGAALQPAVVERRYCTCASTSEQVCMQCNWKTKRPRARNRAAIYGGHGYCMYIHVQTYVYFLLARRHHERDRIRPHVTFMFVPAFYVDLYRQKSMYTARVCKCLYK